MVSWRRFSAVFVIILLVLQSAYARDPDGRFANSPLKPWFEKLTSGKDPCCSDADGSVVLDSDWEGQFPKANVRADELVIAIGGAWYTPLSAETRFDQKCRPRAAVKFAIFRTWQKHSGSVLRRWRAGNKMASNSKLVDGI
jgi:hypothetical protein